MRLSHWIAKKLYPSVFMHRDSLLETMQFYVDRRNEIGKELDRVRGELEAELESRSHIWEQWSRESTLKVELNEKVNELQAEVDRANEKRVDAFKELGRLRKLCYERGQRIGKMFDENKSLYREVQRLTQNAQIDDKEYEELYYQYLALKRMFDNPGSFQKLLEGAEPRTSWSDWAVRVLAASFDQSLSKHSSVAFQFNCKSGDGHFEILLRRVGGKGVAEKLVERASAIDCLIGILEVHTTALIDDNPTFRLLFTVEERIAIKRAKQILEDAESCREPLGSTSNGSAATEPSPCTSSNGRGDSE
jgi:hypothetical protein